MKGITAFLNLIRYPNLIFIILTQVLFQYCIYYSIYTGAIPVNDDRRFFLLVLASVFIAAAGYIINDYFDMNIDRVNKPGKIIVGKIIGRRRALLWHMALSGLGIVLTALAVGAVARWYLVIANVLSVLLLWSYSARFKRDPVIGNVVIALLTSWSILIIFLSKYSITDAFSNADEQQLKFFRFTILYAAFAFIISLIREAVKDIEDISGDRKFGCRTMPIVFGVNATKMYVCVWLIILVASLLIIQVYILQLGWWMAVLYCFFLIIFPLLFIFKKLIAANESGDYHKLSTYTKLVMLTGIVSMLIFYIYL